MKLLAFLLLSVICLSQLAQSNLTKYEDPCGTDIREDKFYDEDLAEDAKERVENWDVTCSLSSNEGASVRKLPSSHSDVVVLDSLCHEAFEGKDKFKSFGCFGFTSDRESSPRYGVLCVFS